MYELNGNLSPNWLRRKKKTVDGDDYMRKEMSSERPTIILFDTLIYKSTARWMDGVPCCHVCFVCVWEWVARKNKIKKYSRRKENNRQVKEMQKCVSEARLKVLLINSNKEIREKKKLFVLGNGNFTKIWNIRIRIRTRTHTEQSAVAANDEWATGSEEASHINHWLVCNIISVCFFFSLVTIFIWFFFSKIIFVRLSFSFCPYEYVRRGDDDDYGNTDTRKIAHHRTDRNNENIIF